MNTCELIRFLAETGKIRFAPADSNPITFKCGRKGRHFMNISAENGKELCLLAEAYADKIQYFCKKYGENLLLVGPAYKGITLVAAVAMQCFLKYGISVSYCYNRKEKKDHGEKASIDGTKPHKHHKLVIIEDVITAGTSIGEMHEVFGSSGAEIVGEILMVDRCETTLDDPTQTALDSASNRYGIEIFAIMNIYDIINELLDQEVNGEVVLDQERYQQTLEYLKQHGPKTE